MIRSIAAAVMVLGAGSALTGCAGVPSSVSELVQLQTVKGELAYRERIALPPDAVAVVEIRDTVTDKVVKDTRIALQGKQVPVPFELAVNRNMLAADGKYVVRGSIEQQGKLAWVSKPVALTRSSGTTELGTLLLAQQHQAQSQARTLPCGDRQISVDFSGEAMTLVAGRSSFALTQVPAASGAKYVDNKDPQTWFWSKGQGGMLQIKGKSYPECVPVTATPAAALQGAEWRTVSKASHPARLNFGADGRISGSAGCNRYSGQYTLNGDALTIGKVATTRMACAPAAMKQETAFLKLLNQVQRYAIAADGTLTLQAAGKGKITARR
ncbi:hypothetical protein JHS3_19120 [Jeongeupia sp. HS-3]|uniref:META domain-containing protein n=1 Tax=Jeongeupia sp. HS-3 TaxID=1009682 RepID=UPI0018A667A5|nr:META domain-containing protein [Jeongeupia sp. HS-3]BCL76176.1 hypothetical protein JHS3_19120 [Jeongeupia sp. HS-3]